MDKIALGFTSNSRKLRWQKYHNQLACEFTGHYSSKKADMNLKPITTKINNNFVNVRILGGMLDLA